MSFEGRVAIVTGAARGIGRAISLELARQGCNIAFNYTRSADHAASLSSEIAALGREVTWFQLDVVDYPAVESMVKDVSRQFGRIDYLVNNAGDKRGSGNGRPGELFGLKGGNDRAYQGVGKRSCEPEHHRECAGAGADNNRYDPVALRRLQAINARYHSPQTVRYP